MFKVEMWNTHFPQLQLTLWSCLYCASKETVFHLFKKALDVDRGGPACQDGMDLLGSAPSCSRSLDPPCHAYMLWPGLLFIGFIGASKTVSVSAATIFWNFYWALEFFHGKLSLIEILNSICELSRALFGSLHDRKWKTYLTMRAGSFQTR